MPTAALQPRTSIADKVAGYIDGVLTGSIVVGEYVRLAVQRHVRDLEDGHERGLWFDEEAAALRIEFIQCLKHSKGKRWAGRRFILEPWQLFISWCVYGWKGQDDLRRFTTAFVSVGKKNGKTTIGSAVGHVGFVADGEPGAEVYSIATKLKQAGLVHGEAVRMAKASPSLSQMIRFVRNNMSIEETHSKYEPLGADVDTEEGMNPSTVIVDELHQHKNRIAWDIVETSGVGRDEPLVWCITTAGNANDTTSIYSEVKGYAVKVVTGQVEDDSWFVAIYTLDKGDDWQDELVWPKANPNLGVSVSLKGLRNLCRKAQSTPTAVANFRRRHCNQDTATSNPWIDIATQWDTLPNMDWYVRLLTGVGRDEPLGLRSSVIEQYRGRVCGVGGDLSSVKDLTAIVFAFAGDDGFVDVFPFVWCPAETASARSNSADVPYLTWSELGQLRLTEGNSVDYDEIRYVLKRARDTWGWEVSRIGLDPHGATQLMHSLVNDDGFSSVVTDEDGTELEQVYAHPQTIPHMNDPIGAVEKLILDGKLRHGGHEPLRWCMGNVMVYQHMGGGRRLDKKNAKEKIDIAAALVMAVWNAVCFKGTKREFGIQ